MIHFLVKCEDEHAQENQDMKVVAKELRDIYKQDVKTLTKPDEVYQHADQSGS